MAERVLVAGVGMVPFATPSRSEPYDVLAESATKAALADAGVDLAAIRQAYAGYVYGDSTSAEKFIADGDNTYGGRVVTNPSGGLLSKGHPLGATGLAQCAELVWQLRGQAGQRQVEGAAVALQHNIGLGGAAVVTLYEKVS